MIRRLSLNISRLVKVKFPDISLNLFSNLWVTFLSLGLREIKTLSYFSVDRLSIS